MRLMLISCDVLYREMCAAVARSPHVVDMKFMRKGLHDIGAAKMRAELQELIDGVDPAKYQAVLMGYGLCGNGIHGLMARNIPLIVPRAHDCIALFMGGRKRYMDYFNSHPGTYFKTTGWIERGDGPGHQVQLRMSDADLVAKYGPENAAYLIEELNKYEQHYRQFTFIEMGVEPDDRYENATREEAAVKGWQFEKVQGDPILLQNLVDGKWDEDAFLTVHPGKRVVARYDEGVIHAEDATQD